MGVNDPYTTSQPQNTFLNPTQGYIQGLPLDDTVSRLWLAEGVLPASMAVPMWGGIPITEQINVTGTGADGLGPAVAAAASQANTTGWSTFAQMMHMVIQTNQNVPVAGPGDSVGFFRYGSNVRLAVACDPALITAITGTGGAINSQSLFWDVTNYRITLASGGGNFALPATTKLLSVNTNSKIITFNAGTGVPSWAGGSAAIILI